MRADVSRMPRCVYCGYDLTGLASAVCPECGHAFDPRSVRVARVPWARQRYLGWAGCYVMTIWEVFARPGTFHTEALFGRARARAAARSFRNVTVWLAAVGVGAWVATNVFGGGDDMGWTPGIGARVGATIVSISSVTVTAAATWCASECLPGLALEPADDVRAPYLREVLLYASAPLAFVPAVAVLSIFLEKCGRPEFTWILTALLLLTCWGVGFRLARATLEGSLERVFWKMMIVLMAWAFVGFCWLAGMLASLSAAWLLVGDKRAH